MVVWGVPGCKESKGGGFGERESSGARVAEMGSSPALWGSAASIRWGEVSRRVRWLLWCLEAAGRASYSRRGGGCH